MQRLPRPASGFTLVELLIALGCLALLLAIALPAFSGAREAARAADAKAALLGSFSLAVHRAAVTGRHAVLCPAPDGETCVGGGVWQDGWIAFLDRNGNRQRDAGETVIDRVAALPPSLKLTTSRGRPRILVQPNGGNAGSNATFTLCDGRGPARAVTLVLSNFGRLRWGEATPAAAAATCAG